MKTFVETSAARLRNNLEIFRRRTGRKILFTIKANAYGHGIEQVLAVTRDSGLVDCYAVDSLHEALICQRAGVTQPILILGWSDEDELAEVIARGVETEVGSIEQLRLLRRLAHRAGKPALVHIKVETGTARLGIDPEKLIPLLRDFPHQELRLRGIYSHFANIEDTTDPSFAMQQLTEFRRVVEAVPLPGVLKHFSCSAASLLFPQTYFDMVRVGISGYGYWPSKTTHVSYSEQGNPPIRLLPALSWHARVAQVKELKKGASVGYGRSYKTLGKTRLVVVPVGYYDGYDRRFSNVAYVLIHGTPAPVRGRICMDMFMAEVTHIPGVKEGDLVTLIGESGAEKIDAEDLADLAGTISYEVLARINPLIPRVVVQ